MPTTLTKPKKEQVIALQAAGMQSREITKIMNEQGLQISERSCQRIMKAVKDGDNPEYVAASDKWKKEFVAALSDRIRLCIEAITPEKITKAGLSQIVMALGVMTDKRALTTGDPTEISEHRTDSKHLGEIKDKLKALLAVSRQN